MDKKSFSYLASVETFLLSPDGREVLLLERSASKKVLPGCWAGLGGKMDAKLLESPARAAVREMTEESGYTLRTIMDFRPAGLYTVEDKFGRWVVFEFTARARRKLFTAPLATEEGILSWIPLEDLPKLNLIPDLRKGLLERMLTRRSFLWVTVTYDAAGKIRTLRSETDLFPSPSLPGRPPSRKNR